MEQGFWLGGVIKKRKANGSGQMEVTGTSRIGLLTSLTMRWGAKTVCKFGHGNKDGMMWDVTRKTSLSAAKGYVQTIA